MIVINETGIVRAFSVAAETMFGRTAAEMIGEPIETLMPEPYRSQHAGYLTRYLTSGEARIIGKSRVMNAMRADGSEFPIELWVGDASTESDRLFTGFIRDHSVRFETEAKLQLLQSDLVHVARMSAVGELSLSLAHELNQPLGAIVNYLGIAEFLAESGAPAYHQQLRAAIEDAANEAMRAGTIVKRLRTFVEKGEADTRVEPVAPIIQEAALLLSSAIRRKGIDLTVAIADDLMTVLADRVQVQQVLFNLLRNAIEALDAPGAVPPRLCIAVRALANEMVEISVEDSGPGINEERRDAIFVPFSSGKSGGMGVGLSISRRIVEAHGGELTYEPAPTGGARFCLTLPAGSPEVSVHD
jgi:two-component system sensor kinase FixL